MYIVHNTSGKTVMLVDLRAEIQPRGIIDLERIADRDMIDKSRDLRHALRTGVLQLGRHSVVYTQAKAVKAVEQEPKFDEDRLASIIRQVVSEEMKRDQTPTTPDIGQIKDAVTMSVNDLLSQIRERINTPQKETIETTIDPEKIAELSQKSIAKIAGDIKTGGADKQRKVQIINQNLRDLASEI